jgi:NUMOD3 motif
MIFINNKYTLWYYSIINNAQTRILPSTSYTEKHHIIPKSLTGTNDKHNLVSLTAREHFICHWLLTKMTSGKAKSKMHLALLKMCVISSTHQRYKPSGIIYEKIRIAAGNANSGVNSPTYGRKRTPEEIAKTVKTFMYNRQFRSPRTQSDEAKLKISIANSGRLRPDMIEIMKQNNKKINHNTNSGKHWYNDGVKSYLKKECPEGCVPGRLPY